MNALSKAVLNKPCLPSNQSKQCKSGIWHVARYRTHSESHSAWNELGWNSDSLLWSASITCTYNDRLSGVMFYLLWRVLKCVMFYVCSTVVGVCAS